MLVVFLGTGGSIPTMGRMHPSIVVIHDGCHVLLDAGEGTQIQLERAGIGLNKRMTVLISHLHADHLLGLPGVLLRFSLLGRTRPLDIYGPPGLIEFVKAGQATINLGTTFSSTVYGIGGNHEIRLDGMTARSFEVAHRGFALGYELTYQRATGTFLPELAEKLGIPRGPLWRTLSSGNEVTLDDGRTVRPEDVTLKRPPGTKIVYSGDSRPCEALVQAAKSADLLICEAMFSSEDQNLAVERGHMTGAEAAQIAVSSGAKSLVLTHLSPRYDLVAGLPVLEEARAVFPNTMLARDLMRLRVDPTGVTVITEEVISGQAEVPSPDDT